MARNKRSREHLDQPTRNHLSVLEKALFDIAIETQEKQPDEFTINDLLQAAGGNSSESALRRKVRMMVDSKKWKFRSVKGMKYYSEA